jgi:lipoyl(octanoyl) transferase
MNIEFLGTVDYASSLQRMQDYTADRDSVSSDLILICEHESVYTLGQAGNSSHILAAGDVPVLQSNRGGQVTYHGPGQVVAYPLMDLKRAGYFVKEYVYRLEEALIRSLMHFGVTGHRVRGAPGIYVRLHDPFGHAKLPDLMKNDVVVQASIESNAIQNESTTSFVGLGKIAAIGVKVSRHCAYHGCALNVAMDLEPFSRINPCGYPGLATVDLRSLGVDVNPQESAQVLAQQLSSRLS